MIPVFMVGGKIVFSWRRNLVNPLQYSQYIWWITWKTKKWHTSGTVPKYNRKIVERCTIDTPNTDIWQILIEFLMSWFDAIHDIYEHLYITNINNKFTVYYFDEIRFIVSFFCVLKVSHSEDIILWQVN